MKIRDLFAQKKPLYSFEFFPPKTDAGMANLERTIRELSDLQPAYVSVTYGAGGSTRERTVDLVTRIQKEMGICAMAHFTCVGASRADLAVVSDRMVDGGVENVIALRGDPPAGVEHFQVAPDGLAHGAELVAFLRERFGQRICLAAACYPEGHPECRDLARDLDHLGTKVRAGVDFLITQLFFDNDHYYRFVERARSAGITVPIVPGIMPIGNVAQIERFTKLCGATIPAALYAELDRCRNDPAAVAALGVAQATAQCVDLLRAGAPGVHFYTLNQSPATRVILTALKAARLA
ncbi:MAG TPA: methylenetetrahydrofolate reductase [NAD(P)H] [Polyangia bacterium]|nr:methylenetetrahydrofolate reductase [NAD(P)H] [Polyangia bacterium]